MGSKLVPKIIRGHAGCVQSQQEILNLPHPNPSPLTRRGESRRRVPPLRSAARGPGGEVNNFARILMLYI